MDRDGDVIELRPDVFSYVAAISGALTSAVIALGWTAGVQRDACATGRPLAVSIAVVPLVIFLGGVFGSFLLLRRQVLVIDKEGIHRRTRRRDKLVRWSDMGQITLTRVSIGKSTMPGIVIEHGVGRITIIYESNKISGKELFRRIDRYVTAHSIPVATRIKLDPLNR